MKGTDKFFIFLLFVGAVWLVFAASGNKHEQLSPKKLLYKLNQHQRYISTDNVAKAIMSQDPSVLLVDVRPATEYKKFALQGAINIPVDSILSDSYKDYVNQDVYKTVFYSNGSSLADRAWLICTGLGYKNNFVMKGGLNEWIKTIIRPQKPAEYKTSEAFDLYEFRLGASRFFGKAGGGAAASSAGAPPAPKPIAHKKKKAAAGGCE